MLALALLHPQLLAARRAGRRSTALSDKHRNLQRDSLHKGINLTSTHKGGRHLLVGSGAGCVVLLVGVQGTHVRVCERTQEQLLVMGLGSTDNGSPCAMIAGCLKGQHGFDNCGVREPSWAGVYGVKSATPATCVSVCTHVCKWPARVSVLSPKPRVCHFCAVDWHLLARGTGSTQESAVIGNMSVFGEVEAGRPVCVAGRDVASTFKAGPWVHWQYHTVVTVVG